MGSFPHDTCDDKVRTIQAFHMDTRGWADIAYNFVVCPHGYTFEGRGWGRRSAANGTNPGNDAYHAVCFLGGVGDTFTDQAKGQFVACRDEWVRLYGRAADVRPHSYFLQTECPGPAIRDWIAHGLPGGTTVTVGVKPMYDPELCVAAVWQDSTGKVLAGVSAAGHVFAWAVPWDGNVAGKQFWGNRRAARIGPRPDGQRGYRITATTGETYDLPTNAS